MTLQILTLKLDGITAGDYLTWCWDPQPPALDLSSARSPSTPTRSGRHDHRNPRLQPPRPHPRRRRDGRGPTAPDRHRDTSSDAHGRAARKWRSEFRAGAGRATGWSSSPSRAALERRSQASAHSGPRIQGARGSGRRLGDQCRHRHRGVIVPITEGRRTFSPRSAGQQPRRAGKGIDHRTHGTQRPNGPPDRTCTTTTPMPSASSRANWDSRSGARSRRSRSPPADSSRHRTAFLLTLPRDLRSHQQSSGRFPRDAGSAGLHAVTS
jgi:hypothetical protein